MATAITYALPDPVPPTEIDLGQGLDVGVGDVVGVDVVVVVDVGLVVEVGVGDDGVHATKTRLAMSRTARQK